MIPDSTAPTSKGKAKMGVELSQYEKSSKSTSVYLTIRQRNIDGETMVVGTCDSGLSNKVPLEYTDKAKFKEYICEKIDASFEALK